MVRRQLRNRAYPPDFGHAIGVLVGLVRGRVRRVRRSAERGESQGLRLFRKLARRREFRRFRDYELWLRHGRAGTAATNLLLNPGFDDHNDAWKTAIWTCEKEWLCQWTDQTKRTGIASMRAVTPDPQWFAVFQDALATGGRSYTLDGYAQVAKTGTDGKLRGQARLLRRERRLAVRRVDQRLRRVDRRVRERPRDENRARRYRQGKSASLLERLRGRNLFRRLFVDRGITR